MKNLMINKNILKENLQAPKQYISNDNGKNINFETFLRNEYKIEVAKYPFLSKAQIKQRVINMWKKQHGSQPKLNGRKFSDKSDKRSQQKSAEKRNYKSKNDTDEHTPPRHRSKRDLVPLKVNFIPTPTRDDGILKRNSNSHGEKRRVSFNKKLYIRYRTTSEESNSSTLKGKQNIKEKRKPLGILSNNPETHKYYGFNTNTPKQDQKFDELLNDKCSWSYKPPKETPNKNMDTHAENLQPLQTTLEVQITEDKCEKALNDMPSRIYMMECSNDLSAKENINELADSTLQVRNYHQMKTYSNTNRIMKTKFKNINVKLSTSESDKTKTTRISMNEIIESSSSSEEIFQTRYSMNNKTNFQIDGYHSNDCSPSFMQKTSDTESILENNLNTKTSPIIIQATAYNANKDFNDSNTDQIMPGVKQKGEIAMNNPNIGIRNRYSLGITTNYSDHIESNSIPIANENSDKEFDFKETSDDVAKDFMNGSFDITRYQLKKPLASEQSEKRYMAIMQTNTHNTRGRNSKDKKSGIKKENTALKLSRTVKKSTESVHKKLDNNGVNLKVFSKGKGKRIQQENKVKDIFDNKEQDLTLKRKNYSPNKTPPKTRNISQKKYKDDKIITESPIWSSTPTRYPKRRLRNSSLVASRKIREIEQLENLSESCEEITYSNDEINYTSKPCKYSNSNNILTGKANGLKEKQDIMLNIGKNKVQSEISSEENEEANDTSNYFRGEELKIITPISYKKTLFQTPLKAFDKSESLSRKDKFKRNFVPDLNSFHKYFRSDTNNDLSGELKNGSEDKTTNYNLKDISYATHDIEPKNSKNINSFNETKRESKHKTWESLERDLLKELDEMPQVDNVCKTVILQEEEVIRKKEVTNDTNLLTVSNTSMLQTIRKYIRNNKYNMHYEIKNTESKIFESKAKAPYQLRNRVSAPYSNETGPNCKSISILEKTIAAMEECTKNLILPQVNILDYEQKESNFQFEDETDNSDANHETQFHTSVTFMAKDNKQYYSNEIIGYMKKSKRNNKKINFKQSNVTTLVKDIRDEPKVHEDSDNRDSNDAEHAGQSISVSKNYMFENHPKKSLCEVNCKTLVPNSEGKRDPWSILMDKLDVSNNYDEDNNEHMIPDSGHTCKTDRNVKKKIFEPFMTESNMKQSLKDTYHTDKTLISVDDDEEMKIHEQTIKKQGELKAVGHKTTKPLLSEVNGCKSINFEERSSLFETEESNNVAEEKSIKKDNKNEKNQERKPLKKTEINEKPVPKQYEEKFLKRSPKYKLRIDRDGSLKIKHSNESLSASNSSQDFKESRKVSARDLKSHKRSHITNNTREKYTRYLKRKLDKQALLLAEEKTNGKTKSEDEQPQNVSKESENVSKGNENVSKENENVSKEREKVSKENPNQDRNNQQLRRVKLIAENDDDIFSLSSSDSETSSKI